MVTFGYPILWQPTSFHSIHCNSRGIEIFPSAVYLQRNYKYLFDSSLLFFSFHLLVLLKSHKTTSVQNEDFIHLSSVFSYTYIYVVLKC